MQLVSPFAPHIAEELWENTGARPAAIFDARWPSYDPALVAAGEDRARGRSMARARGKPSVPRDIGQDEAVPCCARVRESIAKFVSGTPKKIIFVPGRLLNIVG